MHDIIYNLHTLYSNNDTLQVVMTGLKVNPTTRTLSYIYDGKNLRYKAEPRPVD